MPDDPGSAQGGTQRSAKPVPHTEHPGADEAAAARSDTDPPSTERPSAGKPSAGKPSAGKPSPKESDRATANGHGGDRFSDVAVAPVAGSAAAASPAQRGPRGPVQRFLRKLRRPRNGEQLRDTIGELLDDTEDQQTHMAPDERRLIHNILQLHDMTVHDVMVPRADIAAVESKTGLPALIKLLSSETHSRLPVYKGTLDEIIGMVHIKDVLPYWNNRRGFKLEKIVRRVVFAAPSMSVLDLLAEMRDTRIHLALVVDEFGGIDGLVTIEDLVEEIVGEIEDEHDEVETPKIEEIRPGIAEADARATLADLETLYGPLLSDEERADVDTLGGLVFYISSRVPSRGELISHSSGLELEVLSADPRRIHRVRLRKLPERLADEPPGN